MTRKTKIITTNYIIDRNATLYSAFDVQCGETSGSGLLQK